ncbi:MAG: hypothetical protein ACKO2G_02510 [Verrucomicrobiales bacterium]
MTLIFNLRTRLLAGVISLGLGCVSALAAAEPDFAAWQEMIKTAQASIQELPAENHAEAAAGKWKEISASHPVPSDWVRQDLGAEAFKLLTEGDSSQTHLVKKAEDDLRWLGSKVTAGSVDLDGYVALATERRRARMAATLAKWGTIAFTEGHTYRMSFIGYTEGLSDARHERFFVPGTRLAVVEFPKGSVFANKRTLIDDPHGMMRDVDISFDRQRLLFAWKKSDRLDDYHLYEHTLADGQTRQITRGLGRADYEPIYLPDGDIIFTSTRPEQSVPCWWTEISNLYRMRPDGSFIRRLAVDQVHALYPQLLADGRVTYTRWDYNDRGQNFPHPVFSMRPDGQDQRAFYGGNSWFPTSLLHTRGIPGSHKAMSIAAGHHTRQHGKLVVLDILEGRDEGKGMHFIAPRREVRYERVDVAMQKGDLFRHPYPFSEEEFLISFKPEGGERFGLYWMNADGERELLHEDRDLDVARMVPLGHRPAVPVIEDLVRYGEKTGVYYVKDVYLGVGLEGIPRGEAKSIRVVRLDYRAAGVGKTDNGGEGGGSLNSAPIAVGNGSWDVKQILGDVDIEEDGSARFEVPAMESLYLQVLDARGRVIQTTRTWDTILPGETKGCVGCHDKANANFHPYAEENTIAWKKPIQKIRPFLGPTRGFSFPKEIQPILDAKCISCHDGSKAEAMDLRGLPVDDATLNLRKWTRSYLNLVEATRTKNGGYEADPEKGMVTWISKMSRPTEIPPYFSGAARSPMLEMLDKGHHGVVLTDEEHARFAAWMDLLVPFSGDYREGNAWNERQHAYYSYYEGKRALTSREEFADLLAYLGKPADAATNDVPAFAKAEFREVLAGIAVGSDGKISPASTGGVKMIDRLILAVGQSGSKKPLAVRVRHGRTDEVLGRTRIVPGENSPMLLLAKPVRSDSILIKAEKPGSAALGLRVVAAHGVAVEEVPVIDGFHPFLELAP